VDLAASHGSIARMATEIELKFHQSHYFQ